jgi:DNA-binding transcriptional MocR family regulator
VDTDLLPLTQDLLSQMLGVQRTTVTQAAGELQRMGLIDYRRGRLQVLDRPGLERAACECYGVVRARELPPLPLESRAEGNAGMRPASQVGMLQAAPL